MIVRRFGKSPGAMLVAVLMVVVLNGIVAAQDEQDEGDGWITIFDGKAFKGWKANEHKTTWAIQNGALVCQGPRSHLFYVGDEKPFVNFELKADVMTTQGSNAGIYFHTRFEPMGCPKYGYRVQVNATHSDPLKTGSLYGVVPVRESLVQDNEFWTKHIIVQGQHVVIKINGSVVVDYTEPKDKPPCSDELDCRLGSGTFALQAHGPDSIVYFKNIRVKRLPEE